jgi:stage II sporulation protein D
MSTPISRCSFLAGAAAATAALGVPILARGRNPEPPSVTSIRVKLFTGSVITRVELSGSVPLTATVGGQSRTFATMSFDARSGQVTGDGTVLAAGNAAVVVSASAPIGVNALGGSVSLGTRHYNGSMSLQRVNQSVLLINTVDMESYVASTLASEISPGWATESLKAQAIVTRTYGARAAIHGSMRSFDVTDDTSNQVYRGLDDVAISFVSAASATAGMILTAANAPADVFYSAVCGGHTAGSIQLTGRPGPPYLVGVSDADATGRPYCTPAPFFAWENSVQADAVAQVVGVPSADLADISVTDRWPDERAKTVRVTRYGASAVDLDGHQFYVHCSAVLGYKVLPSAMFDVAHSTAGHSAAGYTFTGHGLGHGVGMCQWGARGRAGAGMSAAQILDAYFPGAVLYNPTTH